MTADLLTNARLSFGGAWRRDLRWLSDAHLLAPDYDVVSGSVDLVIGNENLTEVIPSEPILPFLRRWSAALLTLAGGGRWSSVQFEESPWSIGLVRVGADGVQLSVFRYAFETLVSHAPGATTLSCLLSMTRCALRELQAEPSWSDGCAALAEGLAVPVAPYSSPEQRRSSALEVRTTHVSVGTWSTMLNGDHTPFWAYRGESLSRYALVGEGALRFISHDGVEHVFAERPLPALEALADALIELFAASPTEARETALGDVSLRWIPRARRLEIRANGRELEADAADFLTLFASHMVGVVRALGNVHRPIKANGYLDLWSDLAADLRRLEPAAQAAVARPRPRAVPNPESTAPSEATTLGFPARSVRQLRFSLEWTRRLSLADALTWVSDGAEGWLGVHGRAFTRVDALAGELVWRVEQSGVRRVLVGTDSVITIGETARLFGAASGELLWSDDSPEPATHAAHQADAWLVSSQSSLRMVSGGKTSWRWDAGASRQVRRTAWVGDTAVAALSGGRVVGLDARQGSPLWLLADAVERARVAPLGGRLLIWSQGDSAAGERCVMVDATTGAVVVATSTSGAVRHWSVADEFAALLVSGGTDRVLLADARNDTIVELLAPERITDVVACDGFAVALGRTHVWALHPNGERWSVRHRTPQPPMFANRHHASGLLALRDDEGVRFLESWSGDLLGESTAFWEEVDRLIVSERGHYLVVERGPDDSAWLHGVAALGLLAVLDGGQR